MKTISIVQTRRWRASLLSLLSIASVAIFAWKAVYRHASVRNAAAIERCRLTGISGYGAENTGWCAASHSIPLPSPTPWNSIGGCGAGGSGGGVIDGIQWIGNGVQGGLVDVEIIPRYVIRRDFSQLTVAPRLSFKPTWTTTAGISLPVMSKTGDVQYQTNQSPEHHTTGGMGDMTLDFSRSVGFSGEFQLQLSLTLPTGQYDIKRGSDRNMSFLPVDFQMGSGIYTAALQISRSIDVESGFWKVDVSYSHPFMIRPFTRENRMLDTYYREYRDRRDNDRFYYRFKPYGENDLGGYTPPSASVAAYYAYRGVEGYVHSWGMYLSAPLGVAWIPSPEVGTYDPMPDPDHKMWNGAFLYQIEFSRPKFPVLLALSLPIHDKSDSRGNLNGPDWEDFMNQWFFAVGIKATMF